MLRANAVGSASRGVDRRKVPTTSPVSDRVRRKSRKAESALAELKGEPRIMVFGCDNANDVTELQADNIVVLSLFCTGMIPPTLVEYAQRHGADGVFITGCRTGDCYYRLGNAWMDQRFEGRRKPVLRQRAKRGRITVYRAAETDTGKLRRRLAEFQRDIAALKQEESASKASQEREVNDA